MRKTNVKQHLRRTKRGVSTVHKHPRELKNLSYSDIQRRSGIKLSRKGDADKDGVPNAKDCKPLNPKKQGWLHDLRMKQLRRQEERAESKRESEQKKLNDLKDELSVRKSISEKNLSIKQQEMKAKQNIIDERLREEKELSRIREENRKAKAELDKYTFGGKAKRIAKIVGVRSLKALGDAERALEKSSKSKPRRKVTRKKVTRRKTSKRKTTVSKKRKTKKSVFDF